MKKILIISFLFVFSTSKSQVTNYRWHTYGKLSGGIIDTSNYFNIGLSTEYMLYKRFSLNYNFEFQNRTDNYSHLHGSIGSLGGPVIFGVGLAAGLANSASNSTNSSGIGVKGMLLGILVLVMPDGFSYHLPIGYKWDVSPYANLLGFDWISNRKIGYSEFKYACSLGVRGTYVIKDRFAANCFVETRKCAPTGWGIGAGIGLGYLFKFRDNDTD
jgi:hypothetical protein